MKPKLKFGIVSFAHPHANAWANAINASEYAELVGVWDDDENRGRKGAEQHATVFCPSLEDIFRNSDAVGVTSETSRHADHVVAAAFAGVHILCEKPLATSLADCDRMADAIQQANVKFMQSFPKRFDPAGRELLEIARRPGLGEIALVRVRHAHHFGLDPAFVTKWFANIEMSGGGALIDEGVHAADFLCRLLGRPSSVMAEISNQLLNLPVEDTAIATYAYEGGPLAEIVASWSMVAADASIEIYGSQGTAVLSGVDVASRPFSRIPYLRYWNQSENEEKFIEADVVPRFVSGKFHEEVPNRFIAAILKDEIPRPGLREGREALELILSAYESSDRGERVFLKQSHLPNS